MGINAANGGSENGNGHVPPDEGTGSSEGEEPLHDVLGRLVIVMVSEAVKRRCSEILVDLGESCCPVHFVRDSKTLKMDALPVRLFGSLKDRVALMCGKDAPHGAGDFTLPLKASETSAVVYGEVKVSVVFGDSSLRFTIIDSKSAAS